MPEDLWDSFSTLLCIVLAVPIYVIVVRLLLRSRGYRGVEKRYLIGKGAVALVAWLLWMATQEVMMWFWPSGKTATGSYDHDVWGGLIESVTMLFGPIIIAVIFYQISLRLMRYQQIDLDLRRAGLRPMSGDRKM